MNRRLCLLAGLALLAVGPARAPAGWAKPKKSACVTSTVDAGGKQLYTELPSLGRDPDLTTDTLSVDTIQANAPCSTAIYSISYTDVYGMPHQTQFKDVHVCSGGEVTDCASPVPDLSGDYIIRFAITEIPTAQLALYVSSAPSCVAAIDPVPPYYSTTAAEVVTDVNTAGTMSGATMVQDGPCQGDGSWF